MNSLCMLFNLLQWEFLTLTLSVHFETFSMMKFNSLVTRTYNSIVDILTSIKRTVGLPNFHSEIKKTGKFEILMGQNQGNTFPSKEISSIIGFSGTPDDSGVNIGYKMKSAT